MKPKNTARWKKKKGLAVSSVVGAIIMIAVTMTVGFAAWAWARSAAVNAENNYGNAIATNITCLNENFVITNANFSLTNNKLVTVWFFNNGNGIVNVGAITISNSTWSYSNATATRLPAIKTGSITTANFNVGTQFTVGKLYTFSAVAKCQGDIVSNYQQVR
ncbi:MAG: hypothetical protein ACRECH_16435 [Nitrososphaerales archaeon]